MMWLLTILRSVLPRKVASLSIERLYLPHHRGSRPRGRYAARPADEVEFEAVDATLALLKPGDDRVISL
jgi:hypothetical protein